LWDVKPYSTLTDNNLQSQESLSCHRNSVRRRCYAVQDHPRSLTDVSTNRKLACVFLLVNNTNLYPICAVSSYRAVAVK